MRSHTWFRPVFVVVVVVWTAGGLVKAQTPLYPPSPKIDFSSVGSVKKSNREEMKKLNKANREKRKEIRGMKREIKAETGWPKDSVNQYGDYMSRMKPKEYESFKNQFRSQAVKGDAEQYKAGQKARLASGKNRINEKMGMVRRPTDLKRDSLGNPLPDSLQFSRTVDSTLIQSNYASVQHKGEQELSSFLKEYKLQNTPTSEMLVADMTKQFNPGAGPAQMQPYITKFETIKNRKPEKVDAKAMGEGMAEAKAKQKVNEKKNWVKNLVNKENAEFKEKTTFQRFQIGGYVQYFFYPQGLDLAPTLGFQLTSRMTMGVGYNKRINFDNPDSLNTVGKRVFLQHDIVGTIFLHAESEWLKQSMGEPGMAAIVERNTLLGIGTKMKMGRFDGSLVALYNLNPEATIQGNRFSIRYGINLIN